MRTSVTTTCIFLLLFSNFVYCQIQPENVIELQQSEFIEFEFPFNQISSNYFLSFVNNNQIEIRYLGLDYCVMDCFTIFVYQQQSNIFETNPFSLINKSILNTSKSTLSIQNELEHNDSSVILNSATLELSDSIYSESINCFEGEPKLLNRF